jgi:glycosyltransferase involved in cell wall biosynthesis
VSNSQSDYANRLRNIAARGGFADRLHFAPFVPSDSVVSYLSTADLAVHPMISGPMNHEIALPNKLFEYIQAQLPLVVSDCEAMARLVLDLRIGDVFISEDVKSLAASITTVIEKREEIQARYRQHRDDFRMFTWESQASVLVDLYNDLDVT